MGFWKTERGIGGDSWADEMGRCMKNLSNDKVSGESKTHGTLLDYEITMQEFADLVEFCSRGHILTSIRAGEEGGRPLSALHDDGVETYENHGQIHCSESCEFQSSGKTLAKV